MVQFIINMQMFCWICFLCLKAWCQWCYFHWSGVLEAQGILFTVRFKRQFAMGKDVAHIHIEVSFQRMHFRIHCAFDRACLAMSPMIPKPYCFRKHACGVSIEVSWSLNECLLSSSSQEGSLSF